MGGVREGSGSLRDLSAEQLLNELENNRFGGKEQAILRNAARAELLRRLNEAEPQGREVGDANAPRTAESATEARGQAVGSLAPELHDDTAWLIERAGLCLGFCGSHLAWVTFPDVNALRFSRQADAYGLMEVLKWEPFKLFDWMQGAFPSEHCWPAPTAPSADPIQGESAEARTRIVLSDYSDSNLTFANGNIDRATIAEAMATYAASETARAEQWMRVAEAQRQRAESDEYELARVSAENAVFNSRLTNLAGMSIDRLIELGNANVAALKGRADDSEKILRDLGIR